MNTYLIIGTIALIGVVILRSFYTSPKAKKSNIEESKIEEKASGIQQEKRILKLTVTSGFGGEEKTISDNVNSEIIIETMKSTNWKKFHVVQLEDISSKGFKALHVSGSFEDGLASGLVTDDDHILMTKSIETVDQM